MDEPTMMRGEYDGTRCPWCRALDAEGHEFRAEENGEGFQEMACSACGARWQSAYSLDGFVVYEPEPVRPEAITTIRTLEGLSGEMPIPQAAVRSTILPGDEPLRWWESVWLEHGLDRSATGRVDVEEMRGLCMAPFERLQGVLIVGDEICDMPARRVAELYNAALWVARAKEGSDVQ